jgi:hypothetical protein
METHSAAIMGTSDSLNTTLRMLSGDVACGEEKSWAVAWYEARWGECKLGKWCGKVLTAARHVPDYIVSVTMGIASSALHATF